MKDLGYCVLQHVRNLCETANTAFVKLNSADYLNYQTELETVTKCYTQIKSALSMAKTCGYLCAISKDTETGFINCVTVYDLDTEEIITSHIAGSGLLNKAHTAIVYATAKHGTFGSLERDFSLYTPWGYGDLAWIFKRLDLLERRVYL